MLRKCESRYPEVKSFINFFHGTGSHETMFRFVRNIMFVVITRDVADKLLLLHCNLYLQYHCFNIRSDQVEYWRRRGLANIISKTFLSCVRRKYMISHLVNKSRHTLHGTLNEVEKHYVFQRLLSFHSFIY